MNVRDQITPLILTFNEAPNIARTLHQLAWAKEILVVDSFSTDDTLEILRRFPQVRVLQRPFDHFAGQCNFGLRHIRTPWVLSLDADYVLTDELINELALLSDTPLIAGYTARFLYCIHGRPLRGTLYPPRTVLYRREQASYRADGHGHRVFIEGSTATLTGRIRHDDRKPLDRWLHEQNRYAVIESKHLLSLPNARLPLQDRLRKLIVVAPTLVFLFTLFGRGLILDGWPGWFYACQRALAELLLSLRLAETRMRGETGESRGESSF